MAHINLPTEVTDFELSVESICALLTDLSNAGYTSINVKDGEILEYTPRITNIIGRDKWVTIMDHYSDRFGVSSSNFKDRQFPEWFKGRVKLKKGKDFKRVISDKYKIHLGNMTIKALCGDK